MKILLVGRGKVGYAIAQQLEGEKHDLTLVDADVEALRRAENAIDAMRQSGVESGIVSLGSNIQTLGNKPDGSLWTVGIQDPNNLSTYLGVINVGETAVVTSAAYQCRFNASNGRVYHHILSPVTGYSVNNSLPSVTVICSPNSLT